MGEEQVIALDCINLDVPDGDYVAIMGPSGSGKSTLLNVLGCLDQPSSGQYQLSGTPVEELSDQELSSLRAKSIGFIFQSYNLIPYLSVLENIALPASDEKDSQLSLEQTKLLAPFDGFIQNRFLDTGSVINGGVPIIEILDSKNVKAHISIPVSYTDKLQIGNEYLFKIANKEVKGYLERLAPMTPGGSDNRLAIFNFNAFFDPGSIAKLKLNMTIDGKGVWVPIKSLSQSEQGIWAIYTINQDKIVVRDLVDIIYFEGEYAYVNGTLKNGDLVILGGAQKIIEGKLIN